MAHKEVQVEGMGLVKLYKRRGNRSFRLSVNSDGGIRVSLPTWVPYSAGLAFAKTKIDWIQKQKKLRDRNLSDAQQIGKAHRLYFSVATVAAPKSSIKDNEIRVYFPISLGTSDPKVQSVARRAIRKALKKEADHLLPQRLSVLALQHGLKYASVSTKSLKSRWGSCNQRQEIVLNIHLMQLPWHLIDYVLLHELTHTEVLHHGPDFWQRFETFLPNARKLRKEIHRYHPEIYFQEA